MSLVFRRKNSDASRSRPFPDDRPYSEAISLRHLRRDSESRDFRESQWESAPLTPAEKITRYVPKVSSGNLALFGELEYKIDGIPYHLTTSFFEPAVDMPGADTTRP